MIYRQGMSEEEYKQAIYDEFFKSNSDFQYTPNFGKSKIDFVIADARDTSRHLLWAEAKNEKTHYTVMLTQLLLTVKKTYFGGAVVPPAYLAVFDTEEFQVYNTSDFTELFFRNDIEWNTTPSNYGDPRFKELRALVDDCARAKLVAAFKYDDAVHRLKTFIRTDFVRQIGLQGIEITLGNLNHIFNEWCDTVKPQINLTAAQWKEWSKKGVYPADFFLADAYVGNTEDATLTDRLQVGIIGTTYFVKQVKAQLSFDDEDLKRVTFIDGGKAYRDFWKRYQRPPRNVRSYDSEKTPWDMILERRDILVPRDIMERRGSFFTPRRWVETAHEYLSDVLGANWQEEYIVYDCAAGTGNLLSGLYNQRNIYASDIDEQNVRIMIDETKPTFASNIFQFDFLNDSFIRQSEGGQVPDGLMDILEDEEKRKKLVVLINPPYVEGGNQTKKKGKGSGKEGVNISMVQRHYASVLGKATGELYAQFLARIYDEFRGCKLAEFSTLKILQAPNFAKMREWFKPRLVSCFLVPGNTFDNVKGQFPIGFKIWDTSQQGDYSDFEADAYEQSGMFVKRHLISSYVGKEFINTWAKDNITADRDMGKIMYIANDFQQQTLVEIASPDAPKSRNSAWGINKDTFGASAIYFATRWSVEANWLNDRDQFLYPHTDPLQDADFVNSCILFSIFHGNNHISIEQGDNHWIPFTEQELGVNTAPFKHDTLNKILVSRNITLNSPVLSEEAQAVLKAGYDIFKYYHTGNNGKPFDSSPDGTGGSYNHNAALYDIRKFFQGTKPNGHMKVKSVDDHYNKLVEMLREKLRELRDKCIAPKVYAYGFLLAPEEEE